MPSCITWYGLGTFSLLWQIFLFFSELRSTNILFFGLSMWNTFKNFFNGDLFLPMSIPQGHLHFFFSQPLFSFMLTNLPSLNSSGFISRIYWTASTFPRSAISFIILFTFYLHITYSIITFLWCPFIFVGQFPFVIIHFYNMSHGLIAERHICCLCVNGITDAQWLITDMP